MNPDELKGVWLAQKAQSPITIGADLLLKQVLRNRQSFSTTIFWRDMREVGVSLAMVPVWFYLGAKYSLPWSWYLTVPVLLWVAGFMLVDRTRHSRRPPEAGEPLCTHVAGSLAQVEHQIWLLRNVAWWYLLPPGATVLAFFAQVGWMARDVGWLIVPVLAAMVLFVLAVLAGVFWLNQRAVRTELEPRRQELRELLATLRDPGETGAPAAVPDRGKIFTWRRAFGVALLLAATAIASLWAYGAGKAPATPFNAAYCPAAGDPGVTNVLVQVRSKHQVPAIAAAVVTSKGLEMSGVAGTRKRGTEVAATLQDKWHLGSDCKAMTATLVAKLVERAALRWDSSLGEIFPDLAAKFSAPCRSITVLQLLSHRSGLKPNPDLIMYGGQDGTKERLRVLEDILSKAPKHKPGSTYEYSNLGYSIVGAITEKITGKTWEQAMRDEVFGPLGMTSAGFGGTGTSGMVDQPWGHYANGSPVPENGPGMDNPPVLSPAGRVHCTIQDWGKFITDQLRGARGEPALLKPESYRKLHTPAFGGEYALGWLVVEREWGGGKVLNHGGDNTMNCANVWVAPLRDFAVLACINQSGDTAFEASDEAISALIKLHTEPSASTTQPK